MRPIRSGGMLVAIFTALALTSGVAAAKVYKWTDAQGKVHYSAHPPRHGNAAEVKVKTTPPAPQLEDEAEAESTADGARATPAAESQDEVAARQSRREALKQNCELARKNLSILQDLTIRRVSTDGKEATYLTDEDRQKGIAQAQAHVKEFCIEDEIRKQEAARQ